MSPESPSSGRLYEDLDQHNPPSKESDTLPECDRRALSDRDRDRLVSTAKAEPACNYPSGRLADIVQASG
jgi:hypothetical protein